MLARLEALSFYPGKNSHNANAERDYEGERIEVARQKVALGAITDWLDRAGVIPPKAQTERNADIQLAEMTVTELRRLADTLDGEIAERAKVVPSTLADTPAAPSIEDIM